VIRSYLLEAGNHVEAMRLLGRIEHRRTSSLRRNCNSKPFYRSHRNNRAARLDYVRVLIDRLKYPRAREELESLLMLEPAKQRVSITVRDGVRWAWRA